MHFLANCLINWIYLDSVCPTLSERTIKYISQEKKSCLFHIQQLLPFNFCSLILFFRSTLNIKCETGRFTSRYFMIKTCVIYVKEKVFVYFSKEI